MCSSDLIPLVAAGQFATIDGVDYCVTGVASNLITLQYDSNLADPTVLFVMFTTWEFKGDYAGSKNFARTTAKTYINPYTGLLRMMPAGFPCFHASRTTGRIGLSKEPGVTNYCPTDLSLWKESGGTVTPASGISAEGEKNAFLGVETATIGKK